VQPLAGYSGTPLPRKLGIAAGHAVLLVARPAGFELGPLPDGVTVHTRRGNRRYDVVVAFCRDRAALGRSFSPLMTALGPASALWVAWPKMASGVTTDLGERAVHEHGLSAGMVDVKVCAVDQVWSALKFVYRLSDRERVSSTQA
jgi:hypothetical protein